MILETIAIIPATFEIRAVVQFDHQPFAQPSLWFGNSSADLEPSLWFAAGAAPLAVAEIPDDLLVILSLSFAAGVMEEVDCEAFTTAGVWSFRAYTTGTTVTIDDLGEEHPYTVPLTFTTYPVHVDFGPVVCADFHADSHTTLTIARLDDDYHITLRSIERPCDVNRDGFVDGADVSAFVASPWDWNTDGAVDSQDFFDFLTAYFGA